jgi:hypothetical protein
LISHSCGRESIRSAVDVVTGNTLPRAMSALSYQLVTVTNCAAAVALAQPRRVTVVVQRTFGDRIMAESETGPFIHGQPNVGRCCGGACWRRMSRNP